MRNLDELSELELHVLKYFRDICEPMDEEDAILHEHVLEEFVDGYRSQHNGKYVYAEEDSYDDDVELITKFIEIVEADMNGVYIYNSADYKNIIVKALSKFGL